MKEVVNRYGRPAAILGGAMYILAFVAVYLIYELFAEQTKNNFFGQHAFIHMIDTPMFVLLAVGLLGVFASQRERLGKVAKVGFGMTLFGFALGVVGGAAIVVVGLAVSDAATMGILDMVAHFLSHIFYALGSLVFGVALLRKGNLSRLGALLMAVGPILLLALFMVGQNQSFAPIMTAVVVTGLGWILLGLGLKPAEEMNVTKTMTPEPAVR